MPFEDRSQVRAERTQDQTPILYQGLQEKKEGNASTLLLDNSEVKKAISDYSKNSKHVSKHGHHVIDLELDDQTMEKLYTRQNQ